MSKDGEANLAQYVTRAAQLAPQTAALVVGATRLTWADVEEQVSAAAGGLLALGLTQGDRVVLVVGNQPEFVIAYFGALRAGLVAVPLHRGLTAPELSRFIEDCSPGVLVADRESVDVVRGLSFDGQRVVFGPAESDETRFEDLLRAGRQYIAEHPDAMAAATLPDDLALIMYTSGTSGTPRGAMLSHGALAASIQQVAALDTPVVANGDIVLGVLPLTHIYSLNGTLGAVVHQAATIVLVDQIGAHKTLRIIAEHGVTNVPGIPALWSAWSAMSDFAESMAGTRLLFSGSDTLPGEVALRVRTLTGLDVHQGYGLTEAAPGVTTTLSSSQVKPGSVGQPLPGVKLRIVDEAGEDVDQEDGDPGEIVIRGDNLFSGYWPDGSDGPGHDGWFATGDIGFLDDDGDLYLVDRRKELIIVNGFNVYPREVESAMLEHEGIVEAAAVGVPDEQTGEHVLVYVVLAPGYLMTERDLDEHASSRLARFKRPERFEIVDALPHSATGKVAKGQLHRDE